MFLNNIPSSDTSSFMVSPTVLDYQRLQNVMLKALGLKQAELGLFTLADRIWIYSLENI
jgi:hypothetical protein